MAKVSKPQILLQVAVCIWIIICNLIVNLLDLPARGIHYTNWAFFMINILYFLVGEADMKKRYIQVLAGSLVGILLAGLTTLVLALLWSEQGMGGRMSFVPSLMIPLSVSLAILIILHPIFPTLFNNCGFVYYIVALTIMENEPWGGNPLSNIPAYGLSAIAGHIIVNGGSLLIIATLSKHFAKKAAASKDRT